MARTIPYAEVRLMKAIDKVKYLGDVGNIDSSLLAQILPHCTTVEQLMHVENASKGRDLSPITNQLWKKFYEKQFGVESANLAAERMNRKNVSAGFRWRLLYEAKCKEFDAAQERAIDRISELYKKEQIRKQSRQIQMCTKIPPTRGGGGGKRSGLLPKGNLMKKAKQQYLNSIEFKNRESWSRNVWMH